MSIARWAQCLDRLEAHLAGQRSALQAANITAVEAFAPEPDLGPLPPELAARAISLQQEHEALERLVLDALTRTQQALGRRDSHGTAAAPTYLDSRA